MLNAYKSNYILGASTDVGTDQNKNLCNIPNGNSFSILSLFNIDAANGINYNLFMMRYPWGKIQYN